VLVKEIIEKIPLTNKKLKQKEYQQDGKFPVIDQGQVFIGGYSDKEDLKISYESPLIVFGDHTKIVKFVNFDFVAGADGVKVIRPQEVFYPKLFYYFIQGIPLPNKGYARHFQFLEKSSIPLPPLPEQHRIVERIEQLFTNLDAGVEALKTARTQLKRYRQSVLKSACEGRLVPTEAELARAEGREDEPAEVLLERALEERRRKWEEQNKSKKKYKEPSLPDIRKLHELPAGWCWATVGAISQILQYGTSEKASDDPSGIPVFRMGNIQDGKLLFEKLKYFSFNWPKIDEFILDDGDVLFNRTNSAELVGKTAVYKKNNPKAIFASYLIRVKIIKNLYNPDLLSFFINSFYGRQYIASVVSQQVGQANVNGTKLSLMPIPLPPLPEQHRIVAEVERRLSVADELEKTIEHSLKQAQRLRQSILKRAFEGKLVPQDPEDEPAGVLLERIRRKKEIHEQNNKTKRRKTRGNKA
jgi:type I restriction enzyme S subunit